MIRSLKASFTAWRKRRQAEKLYRHVWRANEILLHARYGHFACADNEVYGDQLSKCSDALESMAIRIREDLDNGFKN